MKPNDTLSSLARLTQKLCGNPDQANPTDSPSHSGDERIYELLGAIVAILSKNKSPLASKVEELIHEYGYGESEDER